MDGGVKPHRAGSYKRRSLDASTWDAFAELVERNNGVYGGCWCIAFHSEYERGVSDPRTLKEELVKSGRAHAALVFDADDLAQGWCQYGSPEELGLSITVNTRRPAALRAGGSPASSSTRPPRPRSRAGRAGGRARQIAAAGGGLVEAISEVTAGREAQAGSCSARPPSCSSSTGSRGAGRSASTRGS